MAFGAKGSGLTILSRYVLDGLGLDQARGFPGDLSRQGRRRSRHGARRPRRGALGRRRRLARLCGGGEKGGRFIAPTAQEAARIRAKHSFLKALTLPAGSYPGQNETVNSVGSWSFVLARPTLSDDIAYALARALDKGHDAFAKRLPQARETTPQNTAAAAPRPELIHPGVQKYLREIGL